MDKLPNIPGYTLNRLIAQSERASIYLAKENATDKALALDLVAFSKLADKTTQERLVKHAQLAMRLNHPHIVAVTEVGRTQDYCYIAMPALKADLTQLMKQEIKVAQVLKIARSLANALFYAHERSYLHGHINSHNVLFREDGSAVLTGFARSTLYVHGVDFNKLDVYHAQYMAPELFRGEGVSFASDLYALGIVLFEMLEGHAPFLASDAQALAKQHISQPIPRLDKNKLLFQRLIDGLLTKNKQQRIQNAKQVLDQLDAIYAVLRKQSLQQKPSAKAAVEIKPAKQVDVVAPASHLYAEKADRVAPKTVEAKQKSRWLASSALLVLLLALGAAVVLAPKFAPNSPLMTWHNAVKSFFQPVPAVDPKQEKIAALLKQAQQAKKQGHYVKPLQHSALEYYQAVLQIDNFNAEAKAGLNALAQMLLDKAQLALSEQKFDQCADYLSQVQAIDEHYPGLMKAEFSLRQAKDQALQEKEQARLEAQRIAQEKQRQQQINQRRKEAEARALAEQEAAKARQDALADKMFIKVRIRGLLAKAQTHTARGEYFIPAEDNALSNYAEVLHLDKNNIEAQKGHKATLQKTIEAMDALNKQGRQEQAQLIYQYALSKALDQKAMLMAFARGAGW